MVASLAISQGSARVCSYCPTRKLDISGVYPLVLVPAGTGALRRSSRPESTAITRPSPAKPAAARLTEA